MNAEFENGDTGEIKSQTVFMGDFPLHNGLKVIIAGAIVYALRKPDRIGRRYCLRHHQAMRHGSG